MAMASALPPRPGIWFHRAHLARMVSWLPLIGLILVAVVGRVDTSQEQAHSALVERFHAERGRG